MNNKKLYTGFLSVTAALALAACGNKQQSSSSLQAPVEDGFKTEVVNEGTPISGGTLNMAQVSNSPFKGLFNPILFLDSGDGSVVNMAFSNLFDYDANQKIDNSKGMADYKLDVENKTFTIHLKKGDYKWSDGEPLTIDDYIFTYEAISRPDYEGVRFSEDILNVEGVQEFHEGKASSISGLEKIDDQTVKLHLKEVYPALEFGGEAINTLMIPKHIYKDMTYQEMITSDYSRTKVVGSGPFVIKNIVPGESVSFEKNPYYYKGQPKIDVKLDVVSSEQIVSELKAGHYDYVSGMPSDQYETFKDLDNISLLGLMTNSISYTGFNVGHWDAAKGEHVVDPSKKMNDVALRKAIGYAIDNDTVGKDTYHGLSVRANTLLSPFFKDLYVGKDVVPGFEYNPEKAKEILKDAGYKDVDGDGYVEDKEGKPLTITLLAAKGSETAEAVLQQYIAWWKEVGLNVQLLTGRTLDFQTYAEKLQKYADDFDMWTGGFTIGYNPSPDGLYGPKAAFNFGHFVEPKHTALLERISSNETFDEKVKKQLFLEWQQYVQENPFAIPRFNTFELTAVNKRVKKVNITPDKGTGWEEVELVADKGIAAK